MDIWNVLLGRQALLPQGCCLAWASGLSWLMLGADAVMAMACFSVPMALAQRVRRRAAPSLSRVAWLFGAFICASALMHAMDVWTSWQPEHALQVLPRLAIAGLALATAIVLWPWRLTWRAQTDIDQLQAVTRALDDETLKRQHAEDSLAVTLASIGAGFIAADREGRVVRMNAVAEGLTGWREPEAIGQALWSVFQREGRPSETTALNPVDVMLRDGVTVETAHHVVCLSRSGQRTAVEVKAALTHAEDGSVHGIAMVFRDMTRLLQAEAEAGRLAAIVDSSNDAIIGKTLQGIITSWNPGAARLFGYSAAEALGQPMQMLIPPDRISEEPMILARIASGQHVQHFETVRQRKDGSRVHISAMISPVRNASGEIIGASKIARDITERKQADERLLAQLRRLRLLDQITRAIGERQDLPSIHQVAVRSLEEQLPADLSCVLRYDAAARTLTVTSIGVQGDGRVLPMHASVAADDVGLSLCLGGELTYEPDTLALPAGLAQRLAAAGLRSMVIAPLQSERQTVGVLLAARRAVHAFSSGECEFIRQLSAHVALAANQAQLHAALQRAFDDLHRTQQAALQQERLRALGQMASGIAHDINNAITPAALYAESLLEHEPLTDKARAQVQSIARAVDDVAATVARMREFYRTREPQLKMLPVLLNDMVRQVIDLSRARWSDMPQQRGVVIDVVFALAPELPAVLGIESEIREALINLVFNAVDAMPGGGMLSMRTRLQAAAGDATDAAARPAVIVEVADSGSGMDEATRQRCLEPFFTTKGERGTGLGLAMVYGVAKRHGASISIDSAPGQGTAMRIAFPLPSAEATALPASRPAPPARVQRLRILLVDDDPLLLRSLNDTLRADGHATTTAAGGQEGIDAFQAALRAGTPPDLVITDLGMPEVDGRLVAAAIKRASPGTPVMMLTGWGQRMADDGDVPGEVDAVLSKPPRLQDLRDGLARLILTGRPKGEDRSAKHEGAPLKPRGDEA